jgi:hypothetical protein
MRIERTTTGRKLFIVTDKKGLEYVYLGFIGTGEQYLIPYIDVKSRSKKYWEHHFIPKEKWVKLDLDKTNFDNYSFSKDDYIDLVNESKDRHKKILEKYHNSF